MYTTKDFFDILDFLRTNPQTTIDQNVLLSKQFYQSQLNSINSSLIFGDNGLNSQDSIMINSALIARQKSKQYFDSVLHQTAYNTRDYNLLKTYIRDWYSSHKTLHDLISQATDPYTLPSEDIDLAIEGFGAHIFNEKLISNRITRATLLLALCELYKIKGTPSSILTALGFIGYKNLSLREWWVERDPKLIDNLLLRGIAVNQGQYFEEQRGMYLPVNEIDLDDEIITWDTFQKRITEIGDPHWFYTKQEILDIDNDSDTKLNLPSITPYYSIVFNSDTTKIDHVLGMLEYQVSEDFNHFINGEEYKHFTNIDGYGSPVSITELYTAYNYAQVRADEDNKYIHLSAYLDSKGYVPPQFQYPHAYEKLILWCDNNVQSIDLNAYTPSFYNYYASTNELITWWDSEDRSGEPIPEIFYTIFKFSRESIDKTIDKKLFYNGDKLIEGTTELDIVNILKDFQTLLYKTPFKRIDKDQNQYYSTGTSSDQDYELMKDLQDNYNNLAFKDIYQLNGEYIDTYTHDGSMLLPNSHGVYKSWAIDDTYYYRCISENTWVRNTTLVFDPTLPSSIPSANDCDNIGKFYYNSNHLYCKISKGRYIKFIVEDYWTGSDISPTSDGTLGDLRSSSTHAYLCIFTNRWVRYHIQRSWNVGDNGLKIFEGERLVFPTLDLSNRYDADRILRGSYPLKYPSDLDNLTPYIGQTIIVTSDTNNCLPAVYEYKQINNINAWILSNKSINSVNLGMNSSLIQWIDEMASVSTPELNRSTYDSISVHLLTSLSGYLSTKFRSAGIDLAAYFLKFGRSEDLLNVINFFKPKRARLLFFNLSVIFDDRLRNSAKLDEDIGTTKIIQQMDTFVSNNDMVFIHPESALFNRQYHYEDSIVPYDIGVYNHWGQKHPRPINLKATVSKNRDSNSRWSYGFCTEYPRPVFPRGTSDLDGVPDTFMSDDRVGQPPYDAYDDLDGQQPGIYSQQESIDKNIDSESSLTIKGSTTHTTFNPDNINERYGNTFIPAYTISNIEKPVHHRPLYIAIKDMIYQCYPAKKPGCCDYYDVGCYHDGEGNPSYDRWDGERWVATNESYVKLNPGQRNTGDTYCTTCDVGNYTPDLEFNNIPDKWKFNGVYHNNLTARGFTGSLSWVNGTWQSQAILSSQNMVELNDLGNYARTYEYVPYDFVTRGYKKSNDEIVHIHHLPSGLQFWELRKYINVPSIGNVWEAVARTKPKKLYHTLNDLVDDNISNHQIEREDFLNTTDFDVSDDSWQTMNQTNVYGRLSSSIWVRCNTVETSWASGLKYMNSPGYKSQRDCDNSYIYLCVENNVWIRIPIETSWADTYITPTSSSNGDGIIYRLGYMYMYVSRHNFNKWVRYPVETSWVGSSILLSSETLPTSYFSYSNPYLYWTVMVSNTDDYICPNVIPFLETYHGIWELNKPAGEVWCSNHSVWDQVSTSILIRFPYEYIREYPPNRIIENGDNKIFSVDENQIREEGLFIRDECDITSTLVN